MTHPGREAWIGHAIGAAFLVATVLNGVGAFAKRVGLVEREAYEDYWAYRCGPEGTRPKLLGQGLRCVVPEAETPSERKRERNIYSAYVTRVGGAERLLKLPKDLVVVALVVLAGFLCRREQGWLSKVGWPLWALSAIVFVSAVLSLITGEPSRLLAGLRSFGFLPIALLWPSVLSAATLEVVAIWCFGLLVVQCSLAPLELLYAVSPMPTALIRAAGTLVHPNTLGVSAVVSLGFGLSFSRGSRFSLLLTVAAVALVAASSSGVGWIALFVLGLTRLAQAFRWPRSVTVASAMAVAVFGLAGLSWVTGRPDILNSVLEGRRVTLESALNKDAVTVVLGEGLGSGTNAAASGFGVRDAPSDSTVTVLLRQTGLVGLALSGVVLISAWRSDQLRRPLWLVILLSALGSNLIEMFPVNAMLGLALAHRIGRKA